MHAANIIAMGMPGTPEILLIIFIILLLFGAKKLPELSRSIGKSLGEFKKGQKEGFKPDEIADEQKELDLCHAAGEMRLMAAILDRMLVPRDGVPYDMVNSQAVEVIARRLRGLFRAFEGVRRQSDWKQPEGAPGQRWKSRVRWEFANEYDALALEVDEWALPGPDEEVRKLRPAS